MDKIRVGLIGLGGMGKGHFNIYVQLMNEGFPIELVALCDINRKKFETKENKETNLAEFKDSKVNFANYTCYTDYTEMFAKEKLDMVSVAVPTYEHYDITVYALNHGVNVLCEKPMALSERQCQIMIDTAKRNNKRLMIGQCLRFWGEYVVAKQFVENGELGKPVAARFYRGGSGPSKDCWYYERHKGGGALFDQHIHDIDMVNYLFGMPQAVSSIGCTAVAGSGYDIVSTNYIYNGMSITTQDDWMGHKYAFGAEFHINFEKGTIIWNDEGFKVYKAGEGDITPADFASGNGYYNEIKYFVNSIINNTENTINPPEDSMNTIRIALAETKSCDLKGEIVTL